MSVQNQFDWVDFYKEFAQKLLNYKDNRDALIEKVKGHLYHNWHEYAYTGTG